MAWLERNLECLQGRDGLDYDKLCDYVNAWDSEDCGYFTDCSRDGNPILGIHTDEKDVMLNSTYKPVQEAEKFAKKVQMTRNSIIVFMGIGNGEVVKAVADCLNEEAQLLIYEPSKELFAFVMRHFDMTGLLGDHRINVFVKGINEQFFDLSLSYCLNYINISVTVLETHPKYRELFPGDFEELARQFKDCRESAMVNLKTAMERKKLMTRNAVTNIPYLLRSKMAADFRNVFPKDMPAILVSGGPSLDKNYEVLKQAKGKALIIAVDRTAKYLLDRDIVPDMFCSLDYSKNIRLFQDERLKDIPFLYIAELKHQVLEVLDSRELIFGTTDLKFCNWLIHQYGRQSIELPIGGSVATLGFSFARAMGFRNLILVGQDLAMTGGATYAGGMSNKRAEAEKFGTMEVPGNIEERVTTRGDYYVYLKWFEQAVKEAKEAKEDITMEVINATEGGARIEGTRIMTLQEAIDTYCIGEYNIKPIFQEIPPLTTKQQSYEVLQLLEEKYIDLCKLKQRAKDAAEAARRLGVLSGRGDFGKEFKDRNKALTETTKLFDTAPEASILSSFAEGLLLSEDMDLYVSAGENEEEMIRLYHKMEKNYRYIYENADEAAGLYQDMLAVLKADKAGE